MAGRSKRMEALCSKAAGLGVVELSAAVKALKSLEDQLPKGVKRCGFDQTVEVAVRLGVDPRQADQIVRGSIVLPHGIGKSQRVLVFAQGENAAVAKSAGADFVGGKELADKIKEGWLEFDVAIATPDMMGVVGPLGRVLGPRGLMPSPRAGTVTQMWRPPSGSIKRVRWSFESTPGPTCIAWLARFRSRLTSWKKILNRC